jgi:DNA methylase
MSGTVPYYSDDMVTVHLGDCLEVLAGMEPESVDAVVCDPPYDLTAGKKGGTGEKSLNTASPAGRARISTGGFMGKDWDSTGVAFRPETWEAVLRVLKPGGYILAMGGSRTWHRLACAIEDAGFEIRDTITWLFGSGFPKSLDVSKALRSLPACACGIPGTSGENLGIIDAASPSGAVRAGIGAEPGAVSLAGQPAGLAGGIRPDVGADTARALAGVHSLDESRVGDDLPVVLGTPPVTAVAEGDEVVEVIGGFQAEPEALRDQVVGEQLLAGAAVGTAAVPGDDLTRDGLPGGTLVPPFSATPGRIAASAHSGLVGGGHADTGTVDRDSLPVANSRGPADGTGEYLHELKCKACGGVRRHSVPDGLGTALKPAAEFIVVARKPLAGTVAQNVLQFGTGALNIDGCRVDGGLRPARSNAESASGLTGTGGADTYGSFAVRGSVAVGETSEGRWPPNVLLGDEAAAELDRQSGVLTSGANPARRASDKFRDAYGEFAGQAECTVHRGADSGGASRFFPVFRYEPKAGSAERPRLADGTAHVTVKPVDLIRWLVRLVTPPGGTVLDPFAGSGTTGEACIVEGFRSVLIEREPKYAELIVTRLRKPIQPDLFGGAA